MYIVYAVLRFLSSNVRFFFGAFLYRNIVPLKYLQYNVLYRIRCYLKHPVLFAQYVQKALCTFLFAKTPTRWVHILQTKPNFQTITHILKYHVNIQADKNFNAKMHIKQNHTKRVQKCILCTPTLTLCKEPSRQKLLYKNA